MSDNVNDASLDLFKRHVHYSIDAINRFKQESAFHVEIEDDLFKGAKSYIKYEDGFMIIKLILDNHPSVKEFNEPELFLRGKKLIFRKSDTLYEAEGDNIHTVALTLSDPFIMEYRARSFSSFGDKDDKFHRLIIPTSKEPTLEPFQRYKIEIESVQYNGLFKIKIKDVNYECYRYTNKDLDKHYLILDSRDKVTHKCFREATESILLGIGVVTGNFYRGENYILTYEREEERWKYSTLGFDNVEESVITNVSIISPDSFSQFLRHTNQEKVLDKVDLYINEKTFSRMCTSLIGNEKIQRIITLILEGNSTKTIVLRSAIYSIALETLSNLIYVSNEKILNPIPDSALAGKILSKLRETLNEYSAFLDDEQLGILIKKIDSFNKPSNIDKLVKAFQILGLNLSKHDLETLKHRNVFLHGSSPVKGSEKEFNKRADLVLISNKLHFLLNCLLLKFLGYTGHVANLFVFGESKIKKTTSEAFFRIIH